MLQDTPSFLAYWRNARARTVRVRSARVPGAFTFGGLFRDLAGLGRFMVAENRRGAT